jgi:hypothetical protein
MRNSAAAAAVSRPLKLGAPTKSARQGSDRGGAPTTKRLSEQTLPPPSKSQRSSASICSERQSAAGTIPRGTGVVLDLGLAPASAAAATKVIEVMGAPACQSGPGKVTMSVVGANKRKYEIDTISIMLDSATKTSGRMSVGPVTVTFKEGMLNGFQFCFSRLSE